MSSSEGGLISFPFCTIGANSQTINGQSELHYFYDVRYSTTLCIKVPPEFLLNWQSLEDEEIRSTLQYINKDLKRCNNTLLRYSWSAAKTYHGRCCCQPENDGNTVDFHACPSSCSSWRDPGMMGSGIAVKKNRGINNINIININI